MSEIEPTSRDSKHWNRFYSSSELSRLGAPSQFAAFVFSELAESQVQVVDIGCGNGRDALFFARHGWAVIGVDAAAAAVEACRSAQERLGTINARFLRGEVEDGDLRDLIRGQLAPGVRTVVYARFFLHAISELQQAAFLELAAGLCGKDGLLAVEFRTTRDAQLTKATAQHFRRFIAPAAFVTSAAAHGFRATYFVEGFGFAKYKEDDAHVARFIMAAG